MSENSFSAPLSSSSSATGFGLGYGIAIAVGILVLISTIMLASYLCVRIKSTGPGPTTSGARINRVPSFSSPPAASAAGPRLGLDGPAIESCCGPKFAAPKGLVGPCAICLGEYGPGEILRRVPDCGHCFHAGCVDEWLRVSATCPFCRSSPVPSAAATPVATPLSELIPLAVNAR